MDNPRIFLREHLEKQWNPKLKISKRLKCPNAVRPLRIKQKLLSALRINNGAEIERILTCSRFARQAFFLSLIVIEMIFILHSHSLSNTLFCVHSSDSLMQFNFRPLQIFMSHFSSVKPLSFSTSRSSYRRVPNI